MISVQPRLICVKSNNLLVKQISANVQQLPVSHIICHNFCFFGDKN